MNYGSKDQRNIMFIIIHILFFCFASQVLYFIMRTNSNLNDLMMSLGGKTDSKLGLTTTVKEQVDDIQVTIDHFKKSVEIQHKQQSELQMQLKKLQEATKTEFQQLNKFISDRVNYLTEMFYSDSTSQNKEFEYLQLQNNTLHEEHEKLNEMTNSILARTEETQNNVGL